MQKMLRVLLACLAGVLPLAAQAEAAGEARYVWADQLVLRATPDVKGKEIARLPYGTKLVQLSDAAAPVAHSEAMTRLRTSENLPAADVTLDGNWRQVQARGKQGWVFDGYLSRYPAPGNLAYPWHYDDEEIAYAQGVRCRARMAMENWGQQEERILPGDASQMDARRKGGLRRSLLDAR